MPKNQIAERLGITRTTVGNAVVSSAPPKYERTPAPAPTSFSPFDARVRALLEEHPEMCQRRCSLSGLAVGLDHVVP